MSDIKTTYREVEITYREGDNDWTCELFSKPAETLAAAKVRIDKKLDTEAKKPFQRFKAFVSSFYYGKGGSWPLVEVTSITDDKQEAWCSYNGDRKKISARYSDGNLPLFPDSPENIATVDEIHNIERAQKSLVKRIDETVKKLQVWKPATEAKGEL